MEANEIGLILGEHGFAALIERGGMRLLFDTGGGHVLLNNAARLRQDLGRLDGLILSHGHTDHTSGLMDLLALQEAALPVHAHPDLLAAKYGAYKTDEGEQRHAYIGVPWPQAALEAAGARFAWGREPRQIADGIWLSGEVPRRTAFEHVPSIFQVRQGEEWVHDELLDDQSLFLRGGQGVVIVLGCAHAGMINIVEHARRVTGIEEVQAVIGGTHLAGRDKAQLEASVEALKSLGPALVGTAHCTGIRANARIAAEFGDAFRECSAGTVLKLN